MAGIVIRSSAVTVMATPGYRAASCAMGPPARVNDPLRTSDWPIARISRGSASGMPVTTRVPAGPVTTTPGTTRIVPIEIASAPALRSSLRSSFDRAPGQRAVDGDPDARASDGQRTRPAKDPVEIRADLERRAVAALHGAGHAVTLALEGADLVAELVVARRQVGDELAQLLDRQAAEALVGSLRSQLDHDEEPEHEHDRGDREAPGRAAHQGAPVPGTALAAGGAVAAGLGSTRPWRRFTDPA